MADLIPIVEAQRRIGVSKSTMLRRIKQAGLQRYVNPLDTRERLVDWDEVQQLFQIHPETEEEAKKDAA